MSIASARSSPSASSFAGVLDGGESTVFLGGSRLTRFMETVEKTTTAITGPVVADPWATVVQTGLTLLEQLATASRAASSESGREGLRFVQRDPETGHDYLRIPLPSPDVLDRALETIGQLLGRIER